MKRLLPRYRGTLLSDNCTRNYLPIAGGTTWRNIIARSFSLSSDAKSPNTRMLTWREDDQVYFRLADRVSKERFRGSFLPIFRKHMKFDYNLKAWGMKKIEPELYVSIENKFEDLGVRILDREPSSILTKEPSTVVEALKYAFSGRQSSTFVITKDSAEGKAFCIVPPKGLSMKATMKTVDLMHHKLSGVTEHTTQEYHLKTGHTVSGMVYKTYDVWVIAEFIERFQKELPQAKLIISDLAQQGIDSRHDEKEQRRRPLENINDVRSPVFHLFPHQMEGVRFFHDNNGRGLLADEMGLGKTITSLAFIAAYKKRALVVAPKKVLDHWVTSAREAFPSYFAESLYTLSWQTNLKSHDDLISGLKKAQLVCLNYEMLTKFLPLITQHAGLDTIVLDESHYIKNPKAARSKILSQHKDSFQHRLLLTGTPIRNKEKELEAQLEFLGFEQAKSVDGMTPGRLMNELNAKQIYLRRSMQDEFPNLSLFNDPEIISVPIGSNSDGEVLLDSDDKPMIKEMVTKTLENAARLKVSKTADHARMITERRDGKVIIFSERIACTEEIYDWFQDNGIGSRALLHHGRKSTEERASILASFMESDPNSPRILVSTRHSLSVGINLQCANTVIFNDLPYTPADIMQASARTKRLNQQKEVFEYWMLSDSRFDMNLVHILEQKRCLIKMFTEGKTISADQESWMNKRVSFEEIYHGIGAGTTGI